MSTSSKPHFLLSFCTALLLGIAFSAQALADDKAPQVSLKTNKGEIVLELDAVKAPITVANFLDYVNKGFYNGTIFHRVIEGFMIQGGGFDNKLDEKPTGKTIKNEGNNGLKNEPYTIAMARRADPDSASAQFFINVKNNAALDYPSRDGFGYAVFGKVIKGKEVVDKIKSIPTGNKGGAFTNLPTEAVIIETASVVK